jgi:hypothetical protein
MANARILNSRWGLALLLLLLAPILFAQNSPRVTAIEPATGKVNDNITLTGENLGQDSVAAVFLTDANTDHQATLVEQAAQKILIKVPQVKAGRYELALKVRDRILILPLRFTVAE